MSSAYILGLIITYKYLVLFPLSVLVGPVAALAAGFLVFTGHLSLLPTYIILLLGDMVPDTIYLYIGRFGNRTKTMEKYLKKSTFISEHFDIMENLFKTHPRKTIFFGKLAYGLTIPFLITAGLFQIPFRRFVTYTLPASMLQYAIILIVGYTLGSSYAIAGKYITYVSIGIAVLLVAFIVGYVKVSRYAITKIIKTQEELDKEEVEKLAEVK